MLRMDLSPANDPSINALLDRLVQIVSDLRRVGVAVSFDIATRSSPDHEQGVSIEAAFARRVYKARRLRDLSFGNDIFEDSAWDMLLDLFTAEEMPTRVSTTSLCAAAFVPRTSGMRTIDRLLAVGLISKHRHPTDRRSTVIRLTGQAYAAMRRLLASGVAGRLSSMSYARGWNDGADASGHTGAQTVHD